MNFENLGEPKLFWDYFKKISEIPRCSGNERKIRRFIQNEAIKLGYSAKIDKAGNLVIEIINNGKKNTTLILQSHLDMVCEKNEKIVHNFKNDPLKLQVIEEEGKKWISAEGTTLGADNGIGLASMLALLNLLSSNELEYEKLNIRFIFTVNEEQGLIGAYQIDEEFLKGEYLLNFDGDNLENLTIGCAGGILKFIDIKVSRIGYKEESELAPLRITIKGLKGGHSGVDIDKSRSNALKVLSLVLWNLKKDFSIYLSSIEGGSNHNAIPREAYSDFLIQKKELSDFKSSYNKFLEENKNNFLIREPEILFELKEPSKSISWDYIPLNLTSHILDFLFLIPNGVISMHPVFKDTVLTSINLAKIESKRSKLHLELLQRGFNQFEMKTVYQKIEALLKLSSLDTKVKHIGGYKEWISDLDSDLLQVSRDAYIEIFKTEPVLKLVHAGIECGVFKSKMPNLELLAFGAEIKGAHSPDEILSVESVSRMWELTLEILNRLNI